MSCSSQSHSHKYMEFYMSSWIGKKMSSPIWVCLPPLYYFLIIMICLHAEYICYDDGCHLRKFCQNPVRKDITSITKRLASLLIMVDKIHIAGHVDAWCLENCDSWKIKALQEVCLWLWINFIMLCLLKVLIFQVDTQICEQTFAWLSRYTKMTQRMKQEHFLFFIVYLYDLHNRRSLSECFQSA